MTAPSRHVAFTPSVVAWQERRGSRRAYARMEERGLNALIDNSLAAFLESRDSIVLATASADGRPYVQHRGGPPGFLKVLDERRIAFADYRGNKQYITLGNLAENPRFQILAIDHASGSRVKIWGEAQVVTDDPDLLAALMPQGYDAVPEQAIICTVTQWDGNCPQHIPQRYSESDVRAALNAALRRIAELEAGLAQAQAAASTSA